MSVTIWVVITFTVIFTIGLVIGNWNEKLIDYLNNFFSNLNNPSTQVQKTVKVKKIVEPKETASESEIIKRREKVIANLQETIKEKDKQIVSEVSERLTQKDNYEKKIRELNSEIGKRDQKIASMQLIIDEKPAPPKVVLGPQPDDPTEYILHRSCEGKIGYHNWEEAEQASIKYSLEYGSMYTIYRCRYCGEHHLATDKTVVGKY